MSRSGSSGSGVQSMGSEGCAFRVGAELTEAVWKQSCESEDSMIMSCPNVAQLGLMLNATCGGVSSEVSRSSIIVVSLCFSSCVESSGVGGNEMLAMAFSTFSFFTVVSALDLRILRIGGDFAIVDTVLRLGVSMKSAADHDVAIMNGFVCPGDRSLNTRAVGFLLSSLKLTGLWLSWKA